MFRSIRRIVLVRALFEYQISYKSKKWPLAFSIIHCLYKLFLNPPPVNVRSQSPYIKPLLPDLISSYTSQKLLSNHQSPRQSSRMYSSILFTTKLLSFVVNPTLATPTPAATGLCKVSYDANYDDLKTGPSRPA